MIARTVGERACRFRTPGMPMLVQHPFSVPGITANKDFYGDVRRIRAVMFAGCSLRIAPGSLVDHDTKNPAPLETGSQSDGVQGVEAGLPTRKDATTGCVKQLRPTDRSDRSAPLGVRYALRRGPPPASPIIGECFPIPSASPWGLGPFPRLSALLSTQSRRIRVIQPSPCRRSNPLHY